MEQVTLSLLDFLCQITLSFIDSCYEVGNILVKGDLELSIKGGV